MKKLIFCLLLVATGQLATAQVDSLIYGITTMNPGPGFYLSKVNPQTGIVTNLTSSMVVHAYGVGGQTIDPKHHRFYYLPDSVLFVMDLSTGAFIDSMPVNGISPAYFSGLSYNCKDSVLYGIVLDVAGQTVRLGRIDPGTGQITVISASSVASTYGGFAWYTMDPDKSIFYFETVNSPRRIVGVSLTSGDKVSDVAIGLSGSDRFGPIIYNCHDSTIYGLAGNMTTGRKLARIDPVSGIVTNISPALITYAIINNPAALDPFNKIYYFSSADTTFVGADLTTGTIVSNPHLTEFPSSYFLNFAFNHQCYFDPQVGINEENQVVNPEIFPNPVTNILNIRTDKDFSNARVLDITGKELISAYGNQIRSIDVSRLENGMYLLILSENNFRSRILFTVHR